MKAGFYCIDLMLLGRHHQAFKMTFSLYRTILSEFIGYLVEGSDYSSSEDRSNVPFIASIALLRN
jgi:hypothetical protein